jgi:glycosylphosphatidylinositol deacylase
MVEGQNSRWRLRLRNPWACSPYTWVTTLLGFAALFLMAQSFLTRQLDTKGCEMSYMRPIFHKFDDFDTEHTRFASKYSLYLYREAGIDDDSRVGIIRILNVRTLTGCRSKESQSSSFPATRVATSKCGHSAQKQHTIITTP